MTIFFVAAVNATMVCTKGVGRIRPCADGSRPAHGPHEEMHFADGNAVKLETQFRRNEDVGRLFEGQHHVQTNTLVTGFVGAAISGFHRYSFCGDRCG